MKKPVSVDDSTGMSTSKQMNDKWGKREVIFRTRPAIIYASKLYVYYLFIQSCYGKVLSEFRSKGVLDVVKMAVDYRA